MKKRLLSLLLALVMVLGMLPAGAAAVEPTEYEDEVPATVEELETAAAVAPVILTQSGGLGQEKTIYEGEANPSYMVRIQADKVNYGTLNFVWQVSTDNEVFSDISGSATTKVGTLPMIMVSYKPLDTAPGTYYYRASVTNTKEGCTPTTVYSNVGTVIRLAGQKPVMTIEKPMVLGANNQMTAAEDLTPTFVNPSSLPYDGTSFNFFGSIIWMNDNSWSTDKYGFAGWMFNGALLPMTAGRIGAEDQTAAGEKWNTYLKGEDWYFSSSYSANAYLVSFGGQVSTVLKSFSVTPVFTEKVAMQYTPTLVQTDNGTIARVRGDGESHTLTATPDSGYAFDHWEQQADGASNWTAMDGAAVTEVTLTSDVSYRAVFVKHDITKLEINSYALTAEGTSWTVNATATLNKPLVNDTTFTLALYDGETDQAAKMADATAKGTAGAQEVSFSVNATTRPAAVNGTVLLTASMPNGASEQAVYTLKGTMDITPADIIKINHTNVFFFGSEPSYVQLSVEGSPTPENITWSGGTAAQGSTNTATIDANGKVTFNQFNSNLSVPFTALAADGRMATAQLSMSSFGRAMKLNESRVSAAVGASSEFKPIHSFADTQVSRDKASVASSDNTIFTAEIVTKTVGQVTDVVDQIKITGVTVGKGTLSITVGSNTWTCPVTVTDPSQTVTALAITPKTVKFQVGETLTPEVAITPDSATATLHWSSSDTAVAAVNKVTGVVTGIGVGTAVITATATDSAGNTVSDTCTVTVKNDPYNVKIYVPASVTSEVKLYLTTGFDGENRDTFDSTAAIATTKSTSGDYTVYTAALLSGTYSFRAEGLGGGCFAIPAQSTGAAQDREETSLYLRQAECYITNNSAKAEDFSVRLQNKLGTVTMGDAYTNQEGYACYPALIYTAGNALLYYTTFTPSADYAAANGVGNIITKENAILSGVGKVALKAELPVTTVFTINAPKGADVAVYQQIMNFNTVRTEASAQNELTDGTVDYVFYTSKSSEKSYRVSLPGKRTQAGYLDKVVGYRLVVDFTTTGSSLEQNTSGLAYSESSLLLNINERGRLDLTVGEQYKVRGYRAAWQIIHTITDNVMIEPDFHYTVLTGSDVISIDPTSGGNADDNWAWVTANKSGVAIVEVTYDAIDVYNGDGNIGWLTPADSFFGACNPDRTGVFIVTVGNGYGDVDGVDWDAEYNTVYFLGDEGSLNLNPDGDNVTVSVASVLGGRMSGWTTVSNAGSGFEVPIASGNNVVKITSDGVTDYRVVRGSKLTPTITIAGETNRTEVYPGDTINIGFKGLYMPAPKFSGIYNPGWGNTMTLSYKQSEQLVSSGGTQYHFIQETIPVTIPSSAEGSITLTGGKISGTAMGSDWGKHRCLTDSGVSANFNASGLTLENIALPDLTISVARLSTDEFKTAAKKTITDAFGKYDESKYTAENWTKVLAAKDVGLTAISAAETMSAVTDAKNTALTNMAQVEKISSGSPGGSTGVNKTHTKSYYPTTGLTFDLTGSEIDGYVTVSFEDYGKRLNDADFETQLGVLISPTKVPYETGDTISKVTVRLLDALDIDYTHTGSVENAFYLSAIKDFKLSDSTTVDSFGEFDSGAGSGWMITLNNWFVNRSTAEFAVEDGDYIKWQNTCQLGADIGCDWSKPSAKITGISFNRNYGTLSPAFNERVTNYIYTIPSSVKTISLEALQENYWAILTCKVGNTVYKPMAEIPVKNGTLIELDCAFAEYAGDPATDTDRVTITIQVQGESAVSTPASSDAGAVTIEQAATVSGSTATATVTDKAVTSAIEAVKDSGETAITIVPTDTGSAKNIAVTLPKTAAQSIVDDTNVSLVIETAGGTVTIPNDALKFITAQASGSSITISVEQKTAADVTDKTINTTDAVVVAVTVTSNGKSITSFGGKSLAISIPAGSKHVEGQSYKVIEISADGTQKVLTGKCVKVDGKLVIQVSVTGLSTFIATTEKTMPFTDVNGHWALEGIQYAYSNGLFAGTSSTTFSPDAAMTRAMLVTVLYRMEGTPAVTGTRSFTDVKAGQYYTDAVIWANANGIVGGYGNGLFGSNDSITREQMAAILYRYAQYKKYDVSVGENTNILSYTDAEHVSEYAIPAMQWACGAGLISGTTTTTLSPAGTATRAQVATILMRYMENVVK